MNTNLSRHILLFLVMVPSFVIGMDFDSSSYLNQQEVLAKRITKLPLEIQNQIINQNVQGGKEWWYCQQVYDNNTFAQWSRDGMSLATGSTDGKVEIFNIATKKSVPHPGRCM